MVKHEPYVLIYEGALAIHQLLFPGIYLSKCLGNSVRSMVKVLTPCVKLVKICAGENLPLYNYITYLNEPPHLHLD